MEQFQCYFLHEVMQHSLQSDYSVYLEFLYIGILNGIFYINTIIQLVKWQTTQLTMDKIWTITIGL